MALGLLPAAVSVLGRTWGGAEARPARLPSPLLVALPAAFQAGAGVLAEARLQAPVPPWTAQSCQAGLTPIKPPTPHHHLASLAASELPRREGCPSTNTPASLAPALPPAGLQPLLLEACAPPLRPHSRGSPSAVLELPRPCPMDTAHRGCWDAPLTACTAASGFRERCSALRLAGPPPGVLHSHLHPADHH